MPTTVVRAIVVRAIVVRAIALETLRPYSVLGKSNGKIQGRICDLLFRLVQTDDPAKVRKLCKAEIT